MPFEAQQMTPVSGNQIVRIARLGHGQQKIVRWIGRQINSEQGTRELSKNPDFIQHRSRCGWMDHFRSLGYRVTRRNSSI